MHLTQQKPSGVLPLQKAVLCMDCESVSGGRVDRCPVCCGHSLVNLARILGGTILNTNATSPGSTCFDSKITIRLSHTEASDFSAVLKAITSVIESSPVRFRASLHVDVAPDADSGSTSYEPRAA
jgi:hypothetical protein